MSRAAAALLLAVAAFGCAPRAGPAGPLLTVGTSGDYAPFSVEARGERSGFDVALARAFARDLGRPLAFVGFAWPDLVGDVRAERFEVAMSGVTVRPERSVFGRFSVPVATSGAVVLAAPEHAREGLDGLDRPGVRIAVNGGGHLERVARRRFPRAALRPQAENDAVRRALASGAVDALVTDTLEAPHWQRTLPGTVRLGPFTRDRKAAYWTAEAGAAEALDAWLLAREADGTLAALRSRHLGAPGPPTATPWAALLAVMGERLSLMPFVAEAKRASGSGVRDAAREARVLEAAWQSVSRHAASVGRAPPPRAAVLAFYRAQIESAVAVQERVLAGPPAAGPRFDLARELRPALLRLGDRVAWTLVRLTEVPSRAAVARSVEAELAPFGLGPAHRDAWVDALRALAQTGRANARASSPASTGSRIETP